ncbi:MAG: hypothetical protein NTV65_11710 [Proteobacteria bacterium]|nr:hypothetical protein [Pseudomonadota bacterium]
MLNSQTLIPQAPPVLNLGAPTALAGQQPEASLRQNNFQPLLRSIAAEVSSAQVTLNTRYGGVLLQTFLCHLFKVNDSFSISSEALSEKDFTRELTQLIIMQVPELNTKYDQMKVVAKPEGVLEVVLCKFGLKQSTKTECNFLDNRIDVCKALDALLELGLVTHSLEVFTHSPNYMRGDLGHTLRYADYQLTAKGIACKAELLNQ